MNELGQYRDEAKEIADQLCIWNVASLWARFCKIHRRKWPDHWEPAWGNFLRAEQKNLDRWKRRRRATLDRMSETNWQKRKRQRLGLDW